MKKITRIFFFLIMLIVVGISGHLIHVLSFTPSETFPEEHFSSDSGNKRAMAIVAHDDDICAMSGTLSKLKSQGWTVRQICFESGAPTRDQTHVAATKNIMNEAGFINLEGERYRHSQDSLEYAWMPFEKEQFDQVFNREKTAKGVIQAIRDFQPEIIFTLDSDIGGYGHPDHVFISSLVLELSQADSVDVKRIYQSVFPNSQEKKTFDRLKAQMDKWGYPSSYHTAQEVYQVEGQPEPNVQVDIISESSHKMAYLRAYNESEKKNIRKFIPYFEVYPHWLYFRIFDKEYFKVIDL